MGDRLRLRENFRCEVLPDSGVVLASEGGSRLLTGRVDRLVVPHLNGSMTLDELIERLSGELSAAEVCYVVGRLTGEGLVVAGPSPDEPHRGWEALGVATNEISRLQWPAVAILRIGDVGASVADIVAAALRVAVPSDIIVGTGNATAEADALCVVLTDDYLRHELAELNDECLANDRPWLLAKPVGARLWVGPFFHPGVTGCWDCLAQRLRGHRRIDEFLRRQRGESGVAVPPTQSVPSSVSVAAGLVAAATANTAALGGSGLEHVVWTFDVRELEWERHRLVKRPQCLACGHEVERRPPQIRSRRSGAVDGGYRVESAEHTFERLRHHISPVTGIVSSLVDISASSGSGIVSPAFAAHHAFVTCANDLAELRNSLLRVSGGKGVTFAQARASVLCEALERYSGVMDGTEHSVVARMSDLDGSAVHPNSCMLFSEKQLSDGHDVPAAHGAAGRSGVVPAGARRVPSRFDPDLAIDWTPVWSLTSGRVRHLPTAYCYYGATDVPSAAFAIADSNGCAAGTVPEEAILHGFLELVERDSTAIWWYNRLRRPRVDVQSWNDPELDGVIARLEAIGREVWVLDVTSDLGIPAFAAVSCNADAGDQVLLGFGSHLDAHVALRRAVTELTQSLPALSRHRESGAPPKLAPHDPVAAAVEWWATATIADHPYLSPDSESASKVHGDFPNLMRPDLLDAVEFCVDTANARGLETLILDQTRPDVGLYVVKVVVPGLRHFWPRFAAGRLYDVPVALGWQSQTLPEADLNPVPIYM